VLHVVEILDLRARILREMTESHVLLAAPGARAARSGRLVDIEAAREWDDLAYLNAVDVGRDGGVPAPRKRPATSCAVRTTSEHD
jgi:hypothetical protein